MSGRAVYHGVQLINTCQLGFTRIRVLPCDNRGVYLHMESGNKGLRVSLFAWQTWARPRVKGAETAECWGQSLNSVGSVQHRQADMVGKCSAEELHAGPSLALPETSIFISEGSS